MPAIQLLQSEMCFDSWRDQCWQTVVWCKKKSNLWKLDIVWAATDITLVSMW